MKTSRATLAIIFVFTLALVPLWGRAAPAAPPEMDKVLKVQSDLEETIADVMPAFVRIGGGSGVLISEDGYFLTNFHVAWQVFKSHETTTVLLPGGATYIARKVGWDPLGDTTLCKLDLPEGEKVPYLELGDSDALEVGQLVIILGNPFSLSNDSNPTVSFGVVSAKNRYICPSKLGTTFLYGDAIQTDAPLNPGNSGGPMISLDGKLLGLNGLIFPRYGYKANTGIGYAVSINQIKLFMKLLKENDVCYHGTINGLAFDVSPRKCDPGARLKAVTKGSTAEKAGFRAGDVIIRVNDTKITTPVRFMWIINRYPENTEFKVTVIRGGKEVNINVTTERIPWKNRRMPLPRQKRPAATNPNRVVLGVVFDKTYKGKGARVQMVTPNSGAEKAGMQEGDIIVKIGDKDVANIQAAIAQTKGKQAGDIVRITIRRGEEELTLNVELMKLSDLNKPKPKEPKEGPEKPGEEPKDTPGDVPEKSPDEP